MVPFHFEDHREDQLQQFLHEMEINVNWNSAKRNEVNRISKVMVHVQ